MLNVKLDRKTKVLFFCISGFVSGLLISNITASKLFTISIASIDFTIPVGTSLFALTFICTDVVSDVWGKSYSTFLVIIGFIARLLALLFFTYAVGIQGDLNVWNNQEAYESILSGSSRIILAGLITYPISQLTDINIFHYLKKRQEGKNLLWMRNNVSTIIAQLIDSTVFILIAFWGLPTNVLLIMIFSQALIKWIIAIIDTPIVYIVKNIALERKWNDFSG